MQDYICNCFGVEAMVRCVSFLCVSHCTSVILIVGPRLRLGQLKTLPSQLTPSFNAQAFANWTVNGVHAGLFKNAGTLSYLRVAAAGHEVRSHYLCPR